MTKTKGRPRRPPVLIAADHLLESLRAASLTLKRTPADDPERTAKIAAAIAKALREASALAEVRRSVPLTPEGSDAAKTAVISGQDEATTREILGRLARRAEAARAADLRASDVDRGEADPGR